MRMMVHGVCVLVNKSSEYLTDIDRYGMLTGVGDPTELEEKEQKELSL